MREVTLRQAVAQAMRAAMNEIALGVSELDWRGSPEQTTRRILKGHNVSLDTVERALRAAGYQVAAIELVPLGEGRALKVRLD